MGICDSAKRQQKWLTMPRERERGRGIERVHDLLALVQQGSALHSGSLLSFCRTVILRKTELFFIWMFPLLILLRFFSTERLLCEIYGPWIFCWMNYSPRLAELLLCKQHCPSSCEMFLHWLSSLVSEELKFCEVHSTNTFRFILVGRQIWNFTYKNHSSLKTSNILPIYVALLNFKLLIYSFIFLIFIKTWSFKNGYYERDKNVIDMMSDV